jgi:hypothetical protein
MGLTKKIRRKGDGDIEAATRQIELALFLEAKLVLSRERTHPPK